MQILPDHNSCSKILEVRLRDLQLTFCLLCIFAKIKIFQISDNAQMGTNIASLIAYEDNEVLFLDFEIPSRRVLSFLYSWRRERNRTYFEPSDTPPARVYMSASAHHASPSILFMWRGVWDSNPRDAFTPDGLVDRCFRPLRQLPKNNQVSTKCSTCEKFLRDPASFSSIKSD